MEETKPRVLVVDDEEAIRDVLTLGLGYEGFEVTAVADGQAALHAFQEFKPHVVLLDVMLPGMDGMTLCQRFKREPETVVILLTARDAVEDRVQGLELGADDYVVKPYAFPELVARIRARLRGLLPQYSATLQHAWVTLDDHAHEVRSHGQPVDVTAREYDLLRYFLTHPGQVLSKRMILDRVWGYDYYGDDNVVEVYVGYLRQKLQDRERTLIQTVRGVGYRLGGGRR